LLQLVALVLTELGLIAVAITIINRVGWGRADLAREHYADCLMIGGADEGALPRCQVFQGSGFQHLLNKTAPGRFRKAGPWE
jgi:hypothetical protein